MEGSKCNTCHETYFPQNVNEDGECRKCLKNKHEIKYDIHNCINEIINQMQINAMSSDNQNNYRLRFGIKTAIDKMLTSK